MKRTPLLLLLTIFLSACGYQIAGLHISTPTRFYVNILESVEADSAYRDIVQKAVERYLVDYGELSSYKRATYILDMKLYEVRMSNSTVNIFDEATTSNIDFKLLLIVRDLSGNEVFSYNIHTNRTFAINVDVAKTKLSEKEAIEIALQNSLSDFRIAFANKAYALDKAKKEEEDRYIPILENKALLINLNEKLDRAQNNSFIEAYKNLLLKNNSIKDEEKKDRIRIDLSK